MPKLLTIPESSLTSRPENQPGYYRLETLIDKILEAEDKLILSRFRVMLSIECRVRRGDAIPTQDLTRIVPKLMEAASKSEEEWPFSVALFIEAQTGSRAVIEQWLHLNREEWRVDSRCSCPYCKETHFNVLTKAHLAYHMQERQELLRGMEAYVEQEFGKRASIVRTEPLGFVENGLIGYQLVIAIPGKPDKQYCIAVDDALHKEDLLWSLFP
ncbi:MAG: hypothetical protein Q7S37_04780 [bacterium]|nr:hypothetical protein [bacterium]